MQFGQSLPSWSYHPDLDRSRSNDYTSNQEILQELYRQFQQDYLLARWAHINAESSTQESGDEEIEHLRDAFENYTRAFRFMLERDDHEQAGNELEEAERKLKRATNLSCRRCLDHWIYKMEERRLPAPVYWAARLDAPSRGSYKQQLVHIKNSYERALKQIYDDDPRSVIQETTRAEDKAKEVFRNHPPRAEAYLRLGLVALALLGVISIVVLGWVSWGLL